MSIAMHIIKLKMGGGGLRRVLVIPCEVFLGDYLRSTRSIAIIGIGRGRVGSLGDAL